MENIQPEQPTTIEEVEKELHRDSENDINKALCREIEKQMHESCRLPKECFEEKPTTGKTQEIYGAPILPRCKVLITPQIGHKHIEIPSEGLHNGPNLKCNIPEYM